MGGDCEFLGRDLGGYAPHTSLLDASRLDDLLSLGGEPTEDDFVSLALMGPALQLFNSIWKYVKVCVESALASHELVSLYLRAVRNPLDMRTGQNTGNRHHCTIITIIMSELQLIFSVQYSLRSFLQSPS
jgi:hypothetical protein